MRFSPAQEWLDHNTNATAAPNVRGNFEQFLADRRGQGGPELAPKPEDREALFRQFLEWQKKQPVTR